MTLRFSAVIPVHDIDPTEGLVGVVALGDSSAQLKLWHAQRQHDAGAISGRELTVVEAVAGAAAGRSRALYNPYTGEIRRAFLPDWVGKHRSEDAPMVGWRQASKELI